jgi:hypothetical protein
MRTGTKLNDGGRIEICFSSLLLITMTWHPFRVRRPGGRFPGLKPWAKILSPSGAINYPKSCLTSRHSTLGFYEADDFVKTRWKFVSFYF